MKYFDHLLIAPSRDKFARAVMRDLLTAGDTREATYDSQAFQLTFTHRKKIVGTVNLANLYDEFSTRPIRSRRNFLQNAVRSLLASHKSPPSDFDSAKPDLLLSLRSRSYFSLTELQNWVEGRHDFIWPHSPIAEHLAVGLVYDLPEAMLMVQREQLESWGISYYEAIEIAQNNLAELEAAFATVEGEIYVSATEDHYDASRMLVADLIRELDVKGDPVVLVPNRDSLLITGSESKEGLQLMASLAREYLKKPRPLCGITFRLRDDEWGPWLPTASHPATEQLAALYVESIARDYADQQPILQAWCESRYDDAEISDFCISQGQRPQQLISYCVWSQNQECLLPKTDRIFFDERNSDRPKRSTDLPNASWSTVQTALGDRFTSEDVFPPRYRVRNFPSSQEISELCGR